MINDIPKGAHIERVGRFAGSQGFVCHCGHNEFLLFRDGTRVCTECKEELVNGSLSRQAG